MPDVEAGKLKMSVKVSGGLGDFIVIGRFLRDLFNASEGATFDVFSTNTTAADLAFSCIPGYRTSNEAFLFKNTLTYYDLGLVLNQIANFHSEYANWHEIAKRPLLANLLSNIDRFRNEADMKIFIDRHPYFDGFLARRAVYMNEDRRKFLHRIAGIEYGGDRFAVSSSSPPDLCPRRPFLTIHNGYDTSTKIRGGIGRHTKCWPHFPELVKQLKREFPDLPIVQLGSTTSVPIPGVDVNLINETTLPQVAAILARTGLHFDNESGLVHLAAAQGAQSVVIFGPTPSDFFGYPSNVNLAPDFCGGCWWATPDWMDECPRDFGRPLCLEYTTAERVMDNVQFHLSRLMTDVPDIGDPP